MQNPKVRNRAGMKSLKVVADKTKKKCFTLTIQSTKYVNFAY